MYLRVSKTVDLNKNEKRAPSTRTPDDIFPTHPVALLCSIAQLKGRVAFLSPLIEQKIDSSSIVNERGGKWIMEWGGGGAVVARIYR